jgi:hypothetical protein
LQSINHRENCRIMMWDMDLLRSPTGAFVIGTRI